MKLLFESELWHRSHIPATGDEEKSFGLWAYPQYGFENGVLFGVRADYFTVQSLKDASGDEISNYKSALVPTLTWKASEFFYHESLLRTHKRKKW